MSRENYGMMNQEIQDDEVTIDLMELFSALWAKKTIIILSAVFMALVAFVGTKMFVTPKYTSVTKLFVMTKNDDTSANATYTDLQTGSMLTKDYMELVKSRPVLEKTISKLKLDVTPEELAGMITTETPTDTRIMSISVTDDDPKEAKQIADTLRKAVSVQITEIMSADSVNTVEEGNLPTSPSSPNVKKNMMLGALLGLVISMGLIVLISILDDTVKTPDDVEKYLGLNVLTSIPIQEGSSEQKDMAEIVLKNLTKDYRSNEAYKTLRTNIEFSGSDKKVIVFTSCTPNEGKSTVTMGLAASLAEGGKRVLFVDADLRKSVLMGRHRVTGEVKGLTHFLSGQADVKEVILRTQEPNLFVTFAGPVPPNPAELLGSRRFEAFLDGARQAYDYVIIDAPPLGSVIDAAIIAKFSDASVMVISAKTISYKFARVVKDQLEKADCPILGVVLNKVDMKQNKYYGKYYGNYYGNYGENGKK